VRSALSIALPLLLAGASHVTANSRIARPGQASARPSRAPITLAIDVGGTGIKITRLQRGRVLEETTTIETPKKMTSGQLVSLLTEHAKNKTFDRVALGFPGPVRRGVVEAAPNLHRKSWKGTDLQRVLQRAFGKPTRVANDAAVAALSFAPRSRGGKKVLVVTLGTGFGFAVLVNGAVLPLEMAHHPLRPGRTYEQLLSDAELKRIGVKRWNTRLVKVLGQLRETFRPDLILLAGGNSRLVAAPLVSRGVEIVGNEGGVKGAPRLFDLRNRDL
jgi:polyphosphate glucokinase